jgi:tetratricopeptide (TPR) repeat protein
MVTHKWVVLLVGALFFMPAIAQAQKAEAEAAVKAQNWQQAVALYKQVTEKDPTDGGSWYALGSAALMADDPKLAVAAYEHSVQLKNRPVFSLYNLACAHARLGESEQAFDALEQLAQLGASFAAQMEKDPDLASLRSLPRYQQVLEQMKQGATPCKNDATHRQFDFWAGDWDVYDGRGTLNGTSHVEPSLDGCLLIENWQAAIGGSGKSFNTYNSGTHKWQQFWVSNNGTVTEYEGEFRDGAMRFSGTQNPRTGNAVPVRLTFTPLADGRVRQTGEISTDGGASWSIGYDLYYVRKK